MNEFTGERVVPGEVNVDLWNEHVSRYAFAGRFAAGARVLDLGCGTGYGSAEIASKARHVAALDISEDATRYLKRNYPLSNLAPVRASCTAIPFHGGAFDLVICFEVIEHLERWRDLIAEVRRVLAADGVFIVSTPNKFYYAESRDKEGPNPFHEHEFEFEEFASALAETFPSVDVFLQNRTECFAFYPPRTFLETDARIDATKGSPAEANFFVALCSAAPLPKPKSFAYVPAAANVLREREQHIGKLENELLLKQEWLTQARGERDAVLEKLQALQAHLEEQNRWAMQLEQEWRASQNRIVELQDQFAAEQRAALEVAQQYEAKLREQEAEVGARTQWALDTERRLTSEIEAERARHAETIGRLETAEQMLEDRTTWANSLSDQVAQLEAQLNLARTSRWIKVGNKLGVGPQL